MSILTSRDWWGAAAVRALRTALVVALPYATIVLYTGEWVILASSAAFAFLTSILTSLFGITEAEGGTVPWFWAILERTVKTAAQALITAFGTATMFSEVSWETVPAFVGSAVLGTLLLAVLKQLPESDAPSDAIVEIVENIYTSDSSPVEVETELVLAGVEGNETDPDEEPRS